MGVLFKYVYNVVRKDRTMEDYTRLCEELKDAKFVYDHLRKKYTKAVKDYRLANNCGLKEALDAVGRVD